MTHDEIQDRLEAYVDDKLSRPERREVDRHLETCEECRAILDEVAPVDISALGAMRYDAAAMRRTVRRSMFRTGLNAALLLLAGWILVWFVSALVLQPLVVNRGGRAADAIRMSIDLTTMVNPGVVLTDGQIESGLVSRQVVLDYSMPVGAGLMPTGETSMTIGMLGISEFSAADPRFPFGDRGFQGEALDQLRSLGSGSVATVAVWHDTPVSAVEAQELADAPGADVGVVWAGFDVSMGREIGPTWTAAGTLGYGTCHAPDPLGDDVLGASSAGFGGASLLFRASIERALDSVIAGLENIESRPELLEYVAGPFDDDPDDVSLMLAELRATPRVTVLVVTGPTPSVTEFVASSQDGGASASVLGVDFYNWTEDICGGSS